MEVEIYFCLLHTNYLDIFSRESWFEKLSFLQQSSCPPLPRCKVQQHSLIHTDGENIQEVMGD